MQRDRYLDTIAAAGFTIDGVRDNPQYQFVSVSDRAAGAMTKFGVTSISLLAHRTEIG